MGVYKTLQGWNGLQMRFAVIILIFLFAGLFAFTNYAPAKAATTLPTKMNFQGRITNSSGNILTNGTYNMRFKIFNAATNGTQQWSEDRLVSAGQGVVVTNGQFSVQLGSVTSLPASIFASNSLYFEVELPTPASATTSSPVWTELPMTPRNQLATSAYAYNSETLDGLDSAAFGQLDQNNTFTGNNTFNGTLQGGSLLTLGTTSVAGSLAISDGSSNTGTISMASTAGNYTYTIPVTTANDTFCLQTLANCGGGGGATSVGTLNGGTANATGGNIVGSVLYLQSASASFAGLVDINTQTFAGNKTFSGTLTVGTSSNGVVLTNTGLTLAGTARGTKRIMLTAEYAGAVLDAGSGANNTGSMTAGVNVTNRMNYYKWSTTQVANQNYDVVLQVPIPNDFDAWASTNPINLSTYTSNTTNGTITFELRDSTNAVIHNFVSVTPTTTATWETRNPGTVTGTYTAGDYMTIRIRMQSPTSGDVRIGNLYMDYRSKF